MAHKKAGGSSRNGRDSESKRLGLKTEASARFERGADVVLRAPPDGHAGSGQPDARVPR